MREVSVSKPIAGHSRWKQTSRRSLILVAGVAAGLLVLVAGWRWRRPSEEIALPSVVTRAEYDRAQEAFELKYGRPANRLDVMSWLAEWNLSKQRPSEAIACFGEIPTSHPQYGRMARYQQGRTLLALDRAVEAEEQFRELISAEESAPAIEPRYLVDARQRLRHILEVELRFEERQQLLAGVIGRGEADHFELIVFCFPSQLRWNGDDAARWLEEFHRVNPSDRWLNIALGRYRTGQGKLEEARGLLEGIVRQSPSDLWATAALVACLRESDDADAADRLIEALPPQSPTDPWLLLLQRGSHAIERGRADDAARAYEQLLAQDRTNTEAWLKTATISRMQGNVEKQQRAVAVAAGLSRIQNHIAKGIKKPEDPNSFLDIADLCVEIDFDTEAGILTRFAEKLAPDNPRVLSMLNLLQSRKPASAESTSGKG
jgi:tetratricopeptide (TPR) repeat protein